MPTPARDRATDGCPTQPGITNRSIAGAVSNVYCGTTCSPPVAVIIPAVSATVKTENGACSSLRREARPGSSRVRENTSKGPAKSSTSTCSNRKMPTVCRGMEKTVLELRVDFVRVHGTRVHRGTLKFTHATRRAQLPACALLSSGGRAHVPRVRLAPAAPVCSDAVSEDPWHTGVRCTRRLT